MSNTATTMLMLPIAIAVTEQFQSAKKQNKYSASIGGMATLIGTPPNAIFASLTSSILDTEVSFGHG
jgi:sodium-dependent dicarboxylate transporter 2/3/5